MTPASTDIANFLRERGFRYTPQRRLILDAIRESGGHTTPEEICKSVVHKAPAVNRATVYRNVDFLCEVRLVVAAQIGGRMYYELAGEEPHHHLVCRQCNKIERISHRTVKDLFDKIEREQSFLVDMDHLALFGLCRTCRRKYAPSRRNARASR
jgi:Fur family ferric uptake transcriptional regulator